MSIPIDRLYQYIESVADENCNTRLVIYRFLPNGSKKIEDFLHLRPLITWQDNMIRPHLYCNDQEPLNFDLYQNLTRPGQHQFKQLLDKHGFQRDTNLRLDFDIYDQSLLLHSEKRSCNLEKYQNHHFIPVYYWSHAVIAQDWFRFAKYTNQKKNVVHKFLIYNRAWSGTREYRLKFAEKLVDSKLVEHCKTSVNPIEPELKIHYNDHKFKNSIWKPNINLENYFATSDAQSHYSADFDLENYEKTDIEIVLETLFDDQRLHLTEKVLRPIACGQPFILAGTHGSLQYLKEYGFKTFDQVWDESYDQETNAQDRLDAIITVMKDISNWNTDTRHIKITQAQEIADYNKKHFFSENFFNQIVNELKINLCQAIKNLEDTNTSSTWLARWEDFMCIEEIKSYVTQNINKNYPTSESLHQVKLIAEQYYIRTLSAPEQ